MLWIKRLALVWQRGMMILMICLSYPLYSQQTAFNQQAIDLAKQANQQLNNTMDDASLEAVPHFQGTDVPETQLQDHGDMEGYAQEQSLHNETANEIKSGYQNRPKFTIDPATARDLDDALHCFRLPNGNFEAPDTTVGDHAAG